LKEDSDYFRLTISHPTEPIGFSTLPLKNEYYDKHFCLNIDRMKTGYDAFFTLKPETWKQDLFSAITQTKKNFVQEAVKESEIYTEKLTLFLSYQERIQSFTDNNTN